MIYILIYYKKGVCVMVMYKKEFVFVFVLVDNIKKFLCYGDFMYNMLSK